jgi:hypothetical protein
VRYNEASSQASLTGPASRLAAWHCAGLAALCACAFASAAGARSPAPERAVVAEGESQTPPPPHGDAAWRGMNKGMFVSTHDPKFEMHVTPDLKYIGKVEFDIDDTAHVERHHFVAADAGQITRMLVLQFEEMLPRNDDIYRWTVKKPKTIGNQQYQFSTFVFSVPKSVQDHPEAEIARTQAFLAEKKLRLADELAVARFARVIGEDRRREFIIFYNEPLRATSKSPDDVASDEEESGSTPFENLSSELTERALASFTISELPDPAH